MTSRGRNATMLVMRDIMASVYTACVSAMCSRCVIAPNIPTIKGVSSVASEPTAGKVCYGTMMMS